MRKRRLLVAAGACLATVALAMGTVVSSGAADPLPAPPPYPPVVGVGDKATQNLLNDLCNNKIKDGANNRICQSWNNGPQPSNIDTRAITGSPPPPFGLPAGCVIFRPSQGGSGFDALINFPECVDFARVVDATDKPTRPVGFTYIPMATDTITYAFRTDGRVSPSLSDTTLKRIYQCDPAITFPDNPFGSRPVFNVVRTEDIDNDGVADRPDVRVMFVGPGSRVCSNTSAIKKAGFDTRNDCGDTSFVSGP